METKVVEHETTYLEIHFCEHVAFNLLEEDVVVTNSTFLILALILLIVLDADSQYELLGVVVVTDTVEIATEVGMNSFSNLLCGKFGVCHPFLVQLDAEKPRRKIGH